MHEAFLQKPYDTLFGFMTLNMKKRLICFQVCKFRVLG